MTRESNQNFILVTEFGETAYDAATDSYVTKVTMRAEPWPPRLHKFDDGDVVRCKGDRCQLCGGKEPKP